MINYFFRMALIVSFITGLLLIKVMPVYKMGIIASSASHRLTDNILLLVTFVYFGWTLWKFWPVKIWNKIIFIPVILFVSYFIGLLITVTLLKFLFLSFPTSNKWLSNWDWNIEWMKYFCISLVIVLIYKTIGLTGNKNKSYSNNP